MKAGDLVYIDVWGQWEPAILAEKSQNVHPGHWRIRWLPEEELSTIWYAEEDMITEEQHAAHLLTR